MPTCAVAQDKLGHIRALLDSETPEKALSFVERLSDHTPDIVNAHGVCLLRLGRTQHAMDLLRELVFQNHICIDKQTPPLYQANYATALLLKHYHQMAIEIVRSLPADAHPYIDRLSRCIDQWQQRLPLHQKLLCKLKWYPNTDIPLGMPPGAI